jgi:membrane-associated phospholipid phosphatase
MIVSLVSAFYLCFSALLIGFKGDQLFLVAVFNILYYLSIPTRKFILGFSIFMVFWIIFDTMKAFPNYKVSDIHIEDLYHTEKALFGIHEHGTVLTPNEYALEHTSTFFDVLSGFFYINWVPVPLLFGFYLFRKSKMQYLYFSMAFLFVNLLGFVVYYVFPAAPPWYVEQYGFDLHFNTPGNPAGLTRFDDYFGIHLFGSMYAKSSNVFAAMPSLHSAYPVVVFYYGLKNRMGWINLFFVLFMFGIWFSAVYSGHHYIMDVLCGIACALTGLLIFDRILIRRPFMRRFLDKYNSVIGG